MLQQELRKHQWKAFLRHPMLERNLGIRAFMALMFGILGLQLFAFGFLLDKILLEMGKYDLAVYTFNYFALYLFLSDFLIKYMLKQNQSMQIVPYLSLPIKRNKLFNFLLTKEFTSIWNLYMLILVVPFALKSVTPFFGFGTMVLYIVFFYSLCIGNSLLVNIANNLMKKNGLFFFVPIIIIAIIAGLPFVTNIDWGHYTVKIGEWVLNINPFVWLVQILILISLWMANQKIMLSQLYKEMEGEKVEKAIAFSRIPFLDRLGEIGEFINLELKMIVRSKRLRQQLFAVGFFLIYYFFVIYYKNNLFTENFFNFIFFSIFVIGSFGAILSQYMFTAESSFFDGLMARKHSLLNMIRGKYILYSSYSLVVTFILMIPVFQGKLSLLPVVSVFFYTIGLLFFLMFQNAVYNKSYMDLFDKGMFNWKGTSSNMLIVTMLAMFVPVIAVLIISAIFTRDVAYYFMLVTGLIFTLTSGQWIKWTYNRFLKRKYKNMEGFRSNA